MRKKIFELLMIFLFLMLNAISDYSGLNAKDNTKKEDTLGDSLKLMTAPKFRSGSESFSKTQDTANEPGSLNTQDFQSGLWIEVEGFSEDEIIRFITKNIQISSSSRGALKRNIDEKNADSENEVVKFISKMDSLFSAGADVQKKLNAIQDVLSSKVKQINDLKINISKEKDIASNDTTVNKTEIISKLRTDSADAETQISQDEEKEMILKGELEKINTDLSFHLDNEIYTTYQISSALENVESKNDSIYQDLVSKLFQGFKTNSEIKYSARNSISDHFTLVKEDKTADDRISIITGICLLGSIKEQDLTAAGKIYYETALGFRYKFKDKFAVKTQETGQGKVTSNIKKNGIYIFLFIILAAIFIAALVMLFKHKRKLKQERYNGNSFKLKNTNIVFINGSGGQTVSFGRTGGEKNDVSFNFPDISRKHFSMRMNTEAGNLEIIDLGSTVGTFISDKKLERGATGIIHDNQILRIGDFIKYKHTKDQKNNSILTIIPLTETEKAKLEGSVAATYPNSDSKIIILKDKLNLKQFLNIDAEVSPVKNGIIVTDKKINFDLTEIEL